MVCRLFTIMNTYIVNIICLFLHKTKHGWYSQDEPKNQLKFNINSYKIELNLAYNEFDPFCEYSANH